MGFPTSIIANAEATLRVETKAQSNQWSAKFNNKGEVLFGPVYSDYTPFDEFVYVELDVPDYGTVVLNELMLDDSTQNQYLVETLFHNGLTVLLWPSETESAGCMFLESELPSTTGTNIISNLRVWRANGNASYKITLTTENTEDLSGIQFVTTRNTIYTGSKFAELVQIYVPSWINTERNRKIIATYTDTNSIIGAGAEGQLSSWSSSIIQKKLTNYVIIDSNIVNINGTAGTKTFTVKSDIPATLHCTESWFTLKTDSMTDYASDILIPASPNGIIVTMQYDENSSSSNRSGIIGIIADDAIYKPGASVIQKPKTVSVTISGSVQDQFNYPLIGVTVQLKENPGIYTMTDDTGAYFLGNVPVTDTGHLIFSYIGYDDVIKEIDVNSSEQIIDVNLSVTVMNPYLENRLSSESYEMVNSADYTIGSRSAVSFLISPLELDYGILEVSCVEAEGSGRLYLDITGGVQTSLLPFGKSVILADTGISTDDVIFAIELEGYTKVTLEFKRNDNVVFTANLDNT